MNRVSVGGGLCAVLALGGYALATVAPYPGQELTVVGLMAGLSLYFVGRGAS